MRIHSANGVWCKRGLPLQRVLKEWVSVTEELARSWDSSNDVPWWYNERANLSIFAGGVWRSGGHAFEEFSDTKRKIRKTTGFLHGSYFGRVDMYFETRDRKQFYLESKACESGAERASHDPKPRIKRMLSEACHDVKKFHPHGCRRLGAVFVKPYANRWPKADTKQKMYDWLLRLDDIDCDAMAWAFPQSFSCGAIARWRCPGVVVLIKEVKR